MKQTTALFCVCLLLFFSLFTAQTRASAEEPAWVSAYERVLTERMVRVCEEYEYLDFCPEISYAVYDIDKDGTPELIVKSGTCEADYIGALYSFRDGKAFQFGEELYLGHSSLYSDPGENGIILLYGHMGEARAIRISFEDGYAEELLYEDDLNARLREDPDADYIYPGDVIPGSVYLTLCRWGITLPLTRYEEIGRLLEGEFPGVTEGYYPQHYGAFYEDIIANNADVFAVTADGYSNSPKWIGFQDLLKQNIAANYMGGDLTVLSTQLADFNGDGKLECVAAVTDGGGEMRIVLSEQEGVVYAYLINYAEGYELDEHGNFRIETPYYTSRRRLIFDGEEAFLLTLPTM